MGVFLFFKLYKWYQNAQQVTYTKKFEKYDYVYLIFPFKGTGSFAVQIITSDTKIVCQH